MNTFCDECSTSDSVVWQSLAIEKCRKESNKECIKNDTSSDDSSSVKNSENKNHLILCEVCFKKKISERENKVRTSIS